MKKTAPEKVNEYMQKKASNEEEERIAGPSDYERSRMENIACGTAFLQNLGLGSFPTHNNEVNVVIECHLPQMTKSCNGL